MKRSLLNLTLGALLLLGADSAAGQESSSLLEKAVSGGCFWCMHPAFDHAPGVVSTLVGFAGGREENPTYRQVSSGETTRREAIEVTFDPAKISYDKLLEIFWHNISPIQKDGLFHDIGDQYITAIFYTAEGRDALKQDRRPRSGSQASCLTRPRGFQPVGPEATRE